MKELKPGKPATKLQTLILTIIATSIMISIFAYANYLIEQKNSRKIRVGYIYEGDESMPYTENFMNAKREVELVYGDRVESVEFFNVKDNKVESIYDDVIAANCNIIFSTSSGFAKTVKKWAEKILEFNFVKQEATMRTKATSARITITIWEQFIKVGMLSELWQVLN